MQKYGLQRRTRNPIKIKKFSHLTFTFHPFAGPAQHADFYQFGMWGHIHLPMWTNHIFSCQSLCLSVSVCWCDTQGRSGVLSSTVGDKYKQVMMTNAQLDSEKQRLMYEVDLLKDRVADSLEHTVQLEHELATTSRVWCSSLYSNLLASTWCASLTWIAVQVKCFFSVKILWYNLRHKQHTVLPDLPSGISAVLEHMATIFQWFPRHHVDIWLVGGILPPAAGIRVNRPRFYHESGLVQSSCVLIRAITCTAYYVRRCL